MELVTTGTPEEPIVISAAPGETVTVTGGMNGFRLQSKSHVVVQGFTVTDTRSHGVVVNASDHVTIAGMSVSAAGAKAPDESVQGIVVSSSRAVTVVGNEVQGSNNGGIQLDVTTRQSVVERNVLRGNGLGRRAAGPGIDVRGDDNLVADNLAEGNEDSGIQFHGGATGNTASGNITVGNGDHGIDVVDSPRQRIVSNTVVANRTSGINLEGAAGDAVISSNISVDNAPEEETIVGNIRVTAPAVPGTTADHNVVSGGRALYVWGSRGYSNLAALRAETSQEANGRDDDPDLDDDDHRPSTASSAADAGDGTNAPTTDAVGRRRVGPPDSGALEATGGPAPPRLVLSFADGVVRWLPSPDDVTGYEVLVDGRPAATAGADRESAPVSRPGVVSVRAVGPAGASDARVSSTSTEPARR